MKENIKAPRHWPLCGEFTGTGEFPAQRASNAENVSIWWRHHDKIPFANMDGSNPNMDKWLHSLQSAGWDTYLFTNFKGAVVEGWEWK